jgi:hypothetical protein
MAKQTFTTGQVLTAAQMTSLQQTAMLGGAASAKVASYTLVAADAGTAITMSNASATTITVNTALFAAGDVVNITNLGAGVCTITAGTATVNTSASLALAQYESGTLNFVSTSSAIFVKGAGVASSGGMTLINSGGTALSGASVVIGSIPGTYKHLLITIKGVYCATDGGSLYMRLNADTGNNYGENGIRNVGSTLTGQFEVNRNKFDIVSLTTSTNSPQRLTNGTLWLMNYADTDQVSMTLQTYGTTSTQTVSLQAVGVYDNSAAITSITLYGDYNFSGGTAYVYGVN